MKVAFWSNEFEKTYAFLNFVAISITCAMSSSNTITMFENYLGRDNFGKAYIPNYDNIHVRLGRSGLYHDKMHIKPEWTELYEGGGMEGLLRRFYRGEYSPDILRAYLKEVIPYHLYYIPQNRVINNELFDYELYNNLNELFKIIDISSDMCFIHTLQQNHLSSNAILQEADLIVINLLQNSEYLEYFFKNYYSLIPKSVFIIGNYSAKSILSCKRISKLYDIPLENISPIPYNEDFYVACNYMGAKEFINNNYYCPRDSAHYLFIYGIRRAAHMIAKKYSETLHLANREMESCRV